jgi:4-amino-4-deoxy-L-arabinose transferase-like glycosyltransferase
VALDSPRTRTLLVVLALAAAALATRLAVLDADPSRFKRVHELFDEGYWAHNARAAVLFGVRYPDDLAQAAASAPLFDWITERVFRLAGVGYTQLRVTSAIASVALVPLVWALVAAGAGPRAALAAALLVLTNHELFAFGRLGLPESLQLLLAIAGAGAWTMRRRPRDAAVAGILLALALLAKLNVVLVLGFAGVWALEAWQRRLRIGEVAVFVAGFVPPVAAWGVWGYLPNRPLFALNQLALNRDRVAQQWSDLVRLPLHFLDADFWGLPSTYLLLLLAAVHLARARPRSVRDLTRLETLALGWLAGIALPSALLVRSIDERRFLVVPVLLAILAAPSWHRVPREHDPGLRPAREASRGLALGAAAAIAIVGVALLFRAGHGTRLWSPPIAVLAVAALAALGIGLDRLRARLGRRALVAVMVAALALLPALNAGEFVAWLVRGVEADAPVLARGVAVVVVAVALLVAFAPAPRATRGLAAAYGLYAVLAIGAGLGAPTFTLRDASRAIAAAAPPDAVVVGALAHTLSLENRTRPVWYTPKRALNNLLNADLARFDVRLVLTLIPPSRFYLEAEEYPFPLTPVGRFGVYPAPHLGGPPRTKIVLTLHRRE